MRDFRLIWEEGECLLLTSEASKTWNFWTISPVWARRVKKQGYELQEDHQAGWNCRIPIDRIRILRPKKRKTGFALHLKSQNESTGARSGVISCNQNSKARIG